MDNQLDRINKTLEKTLNRHGYSFQYSVVSKANELFKNHQSNWRAPVTEFPSEVKGFGTRIDTILQYKDKPIFLIIETKRANPALSNWCFLEAPYINTGINKPIVESITKNQSQYRTSIAGLEKPREVCHLGLEIKSTKKGDPCSSGRGAIEDAAAQVLRGLNGLIEFFKPQHEMLKEYGTITVLPAIITTANIFYSNAKLSNADLNSGEIDLSDETIEKRDWLFYNYNQSPGLKHSIQPNRKYPEFEKALQNLYIRTIPVISPIGLEDFLGRNLFE